MKNPVLITGATGSMGSVAVKAMASEGFPVIMACRNLKKGKEVLDKVRSEVPDSSIELVCLDLASQASVRSLCSQLSGVRLSALFNNAGVISRSYSLTKDGVEQTMAVNYLNPVLLTRLLTSNIEPGGRVVNMVSLTARMGKLDLSWPEMEKKQFRRLPVYASSKRALLYFSIAYARRHPDLRVNVSDPGVVNSNMISMGRWFDPLADIFFRPFISSPEKGVAPAIRALHAEDSLRYYVGKKSDMIDREFLDDGISEALWVQASDILGLPSAIHDSGSL